MKNIILFCLISFVVGAAFKPVEKKFPSIQLKNLDGKSVDISKTFSNNKLTVISYWATWCSPCKKELDAIKPLYQNWKKDGIEVIAISIDNVQQINKIKPMVKQKSWEYTVLSDVNSESLRVLNFQTVPQTFVVDSEGMIVYTHSGYTPGEEKDLEKKLQSLLAK